MELLYNLYPSKKQDDYFLFKKTKIYIKQYGINIQNYDKTTRKKNQNRGSHSLPIERFSDCRCQERPTSTPIPCSISVFRMSHSELHHPSHPPNPGMSHFFTPFPTIPNHPSHAPPPNSQYRFRKKGKEKKKKSKIRGDANFQNDTYLCICVQSPRIRIFHPYRRVQ